MGLFKSLIIIAVVVTAIVVLLRGVGKGTSRKSTKKIASILSGGKKEGYTNGGCMATWPSKCFDCDAQMCRCGKNTGQRLDDTEGGFARLGRM